VDRGGREGNSDTMNEGIDTQKRRRERGRHLTGREVESRLLQLKGVGSKIKEKTGKR